MNDINRQEDNYNDFSQVDDNFKEIKQLDNDVITSVHYSVKDLNKEISHFDNINDNIYKIDLDEFVRDNTRENIFANNDIENTNNTNEHNNKEELLFQNIDDNKAYDYENKLIIVENYKDTQD
jgi:hypothetical protein